MLQIRRAAPNEYSAIRQMVRDAHLDPTSRLHFEHVLVAELDGEVVGVGQIKHHSGCQELGSLVVQPEYRGRGIAAQLITALEAEAERPLYLTCLSHMEPYYARFGYESIPFREMPAFFKLKMLPAGIARLFGLHPRVMRKI